MTFGCALRIPGDLCIFQEGNVDRQIFVNEFRTHMNDIKAVPAKHHCKIEPFVFKELSTCTHVFWLIKAVKPPLVQPYAGPYKVISRHPTDRFFTIDIAGKHKTISVESLKPAYGLGRDLVDDHLARDDFEDVLDASIEPHSREQSTEVAPNDLHAEEPVEDAWLPPTAPSLLEHKRRAIESEAATRARGEQQIDNPTPTNKINNQLTESTNKPKKRVRFIPNILRRFRK